ncbi:MAG TPA: hypothetical protein VGH42_07765 [Verrucomicrobiae bacterium]|jgi:hypothetical protein
MISKCQCQHCGGSIEFDADQLDRSGATSYRILGQVVECPHCHQSTQLYLNLAEFVAPKNPAGFPSTLESPKLKSKTKSAVGFIGILFPVIVGIGLLLVGFVNAGSAETIMQQIYGAIEFCTGWIILCLAIIINVLATINDNLK